MYAFVGASAAQIAGAITAPLCAAGAIRLADRWGAPDGEGGVTTARSTLFMFVGALALICVALTAGDGFETLAWLIFFTVLLYLAAVDLQTMAIPVWPAISIIFLGVGFSLFEGGVFGGIVASVSALVGWLAFRGLDILFLKVRGRHGLGAGDALIAAAIGGWMALTDLAWATACGCGATLIWIVATQTRKRDFSSPFPLAPGLLVGSFALFEYRRIVGVG